MVWTCHKPRPDLGLFLEQVLHSSDIQKIHIKAGADEGVRNGFAIGREFGHEIVDIVVATDGVAGQEETLERSFLEMLKLKGSVQPKPIAFAFEFHKEDENMVALKGNVLDNRLFKLNLLDGEGPGGRRL